MLVLQLVTLCSFNFLFDLERVCLLLLLVLVKL